VFNLEKKLEKKLEKNQSQRAKVSIGRKNFFAEPIKLYYRSEVLTSKNARHRHTLNLIQIPNATTHMAKEKGQKKEGDQHPRFPPGPPRQY
jgi:hypothetical protein